MLHGQVAHQIGRDIVSGRIREGDFLPRESELAGHFKVSRQAVREALKVLAAKGLVGSRRRTGTFVLPRSSWNIFDQDVIAWHPPGSMSPEFFKAIIELRHVLEPAAAALAAERATDEQIAAIGSALQGMRDCFRGHPEGLNEADARFHLAIFEASGNDLFVRLGALIRPLLDVAFTSLNAGRILDEAQFIGSHAVMYDAIVERNPAKARQFVETGLATGLRLMDRHTPPELSVKDVEPRLRVVKAGRGPSPS